MSNKFLKYIFIFTCSIFLFGGELFADQTNIQVMSATVKDKIIPNAQLIFQKNGETSVIAKTDSRGIANVTAPFGGVDDSSVMLIVKKDGYSNMVVKCPCNDLTYALSSKMKELDGLRVVLSWNNQPQDLDSHLSFPGNQE